MLLVPDLVKEYTPNALVDVVPLMLSPMVLKSPSSPAPSRVTVTPFTPAVSPPFWIPLALRSTKILSPMVIARKKPASTLLSVCPGMTLTSPERFVALRMSLSTASLESRLAGLSVYPDGGITLI